MATGQPAPKKDIQYLETLLSKRIEYVKQLKFEMSNELSVTAQTVAAYSDLLEEILTDIAVHAHRNVKTGAVTKESLQKLHAPSTRTQAAPIVEKAGKGPFVDVFGQVLAQQPREEVTCVHCGRRIAAARFAPHLEKCLGKGRNASRLASRRTSLAGM